MHVVKANIQNLFRFKQLYLKPIVQVLLELSCHQRFMLCLHFLLLFQYRPCFGLLEYLKTEDFYHRKKRRKKTKKYILTICRTYYKYFYRVEKHFVPYVAFSALFFPLSSFVVLCVAILHFLFVP